MVKIIKARIPVKKIVLDEKLYPRNQVSWQTAYDYSESMKAGAKFPRIVLAQVKGDISGTFFLVDGAHRLEAQKKYLKATNVDCEIIVGILKDKIYEEAVRRNIIHGRQFSIQERLKIACHLKDLHYDTAQISGLVRIVPSKLTQLMGRKLINSITGEEIILKKEGEPLVETRANGYSYEAEIEELQSKFSGRSQEQIVDELLVLISSKTIDLKDKKLKDKLKKLRSLLRTLKL